MAIPIRTTITCPACGTSEDITMGDTSIGPQGRVSDAPIYAFLRHALWPTSHRDGEQWISCAICGEQDFITVAKQARIRQGGPGALAGRLTTKKGAKP